MARINKKTGKIIPDTKKAKDKKEPEGLEIKQQDNNADVKNPKVSQDAPKILPKKSKLKSETVEPVSNTKKIDALDVKKGRRKKEETEEIKIKKTKAKKKKPEKVKKEREKSPLSKSRRQTLRDNAKAKKLPRGGFKSDIEQQYYETWFSKYHGESFDLEKKKKEIEDDKKKKRRLKYLRNKGLKNENNVKFKNEEERKAFEEGNEIFKDANIEKLSQDNALNLTFSEKMKLHVATGGVSNTITYILGGSHFTYAYYEVRRDIAYNEHETAIILANDFNYKFKNAKVFYTTFREAALHVIKGNIKSLGLSDYSELEIEDAYESMLDDDEWQLYQNNEAGRNFKSVNEIAKLLLNELKKNGKKSKKINNLDKQLPF